MNARPRVLVADAVDERAKALLEAEGIDVSWRAGIAPADLPAAVAGQDGLIVRSRTKVTAAVLAAGSALRVVGRAGAGVDNIDLEEATRRGIVVMNAPGGNTVSTAEHTIAMMLALARNIPAADRSVRAMEWKRERFTGMEVSGKVLGLVGLGKVGREVAARAAALGMTVLAHDPIVSDDTARSYGIEPAPLAELFRRSDVITVHTPLTPDTEGLIDAAALRSCKRGVRIINCARGGIVDEAALLEALDAGAVAGAALDVFVEEPPSNVKLVTHPSVICTPHLGASTGEAQEKVAVQLARQVADFLLGRGAAGAVNADALDAAMRGGTGTLLLLAGRMGELMSRLGPGPVQAIRLEAAEGVPPGAAGAILAALVAGFLSPMLSERVNLVNALALASGRGISAAVVPPRGSSGWPAGLTAEFTTDHGTRTVGGAVFGADQPRILLIDGYRVEVKPDGWLLIYSNVDRPGMLARVSSLLATRSINIAALSLGRLKPGEEALTVVSLDEPAPDELLREIAKIEGLSGLHLIHL